MEKSTEINSNAFMEKPEVKALRKSYLGKVPNEISIVEKYATESLEQSEKIAIDDTYYGIVHKIKGVGGTFGFPLISEAAIKILDMFTKEAKEHTCYLTKDQGFLLLDLIADMKKHSEFYQKELDV